MNTSRRRAARRRLGREAAFVASLEAYERGGNAEALLQAADAVIASKRPIAQEHADTISVLTDNLGIVIETYSEAAHAVRLWFEAMQNPDSEH